MADANILKLSAAAGRRRSFAASQKKGTGGATPPAAGGPGSPGPVAGLTGLNKPIPARAVGPNGGATAAPAPAPSPYAAHAVALSGIAQANGAPDLASAIRSVAATPHPADKHAVAMNYLKAQHPDVAAKHQHMFTKTLITGGGSPGPAPGIGAGAPPMPGMSQ